LIDRPQRGEKAILLHARLGSSPLPEEQEEFHALALAAGAEVVGGLVAHLRRANPRHLIGTGKLAELKELVEGTGAELVLVDHHLSPGQQRNLEKALCLRVVDRTELILDIFAQRARTHEGKLQVELAQLEHLSTRLVRGWTHLERQKGGIGLRGPGETQLETDRRLVSQRIRQLEERLARVSRHRQVVGQQRRRAEVPTVSLVGYTNAGKSTLFNRLTDASVLVADQLFATLDPTLRRVALADGSHVVLADTVGFIRDLPHELIAAFRSTLEETRDSRLLLHVVDAADPARDERIEDVVGVLREIGADHLPRVLVYNKIDILQVPPRVDRSETGMPVRVWLSSRTGLGVDALPGIIAEYLHREIVRGTAELAVTESRLRALLYQLGVVVAERNLAGGGWELDLEMDQRGYEDLSRREQLRFRQSAEPLQPAVTH
jgi:GTP-binding protein HflX